MITFLSSTVLELFLEVIKSLALTLACGAKSLLTTLQAR